MQYSVLKEIFSYLIKSGRGTTLLFEEESVLNYVKIASYGL